MKYIITGLHCSGKQEVIDLLRERGVKCGKLFSDIPLASDLIYGSRDMDLLSSAQVRGIFENDAYIFIQSIDTPSMPSTYSCFEGLSFYDFDNNDVFLLSPDQIVNIPASRDLSDVCFVWMDNTESDRRGRYTYEGRQYGFRQRDEIEKQDTDAFVKYIMSHNNIYFTNEDPRRVASIIQMCVLHPDQVGIVLENFD